MSTRGVDKGCVFMAVATAWLGPPLSKQHGPAPLPSIQGVQRWGLGSQRQDADSINVDKLGALERGCRQQGPVPAEFYGSTEVVMVSQLVAGG